MQMSCDSENPLFSHIFFELGYHTYYYNKNARQALGGPAPTGQGTPRGLEGIISSPIMHWRAFFILFHHI